LGDGALPPLLINAAALFAYIDILVSLFVFLLVCFRQFFMFALFYYLFLLPLGVAILSLSLCQSWDWLTFLCYSNLL
jgi:hypothetical protein